MKNMKNRKQNSFAGIMAAAAIISILFMACATTGGTTGSSASVEAASVGETIVCLGDSLTSGYNATVAGKNDRNNAYPAFLQKKVNIPVVNAGKNNELTTQVVARVKKDVLSQNPRIVIIALGGNDFVQKVPLSTTKNNIQKIIDMVNDGNRKIYLYKWLLTENHEDMFNSLASSNNIELVNSLYNGVWGVKENLSADGVHPNAKGYEIVANNVFEEIKPYLEANNLLKE
jgi:acyl-CoA thioesterase-1